MTSAARSELQQDTFVSNIARIGGRNGSAGLSDSLVGKISDDDELSIILFGIGGSLFALPTMSVLEVVRSGEIVAIPRSPDFIEGIIEIREQVVPVVDLRKRLGQPGRQGDDSIIIVALVSGEKTGFIVDSAHKVLSLANEEMQDIGAVLSGPERRYVFRTVSRNKEPIVILNIDSILNDEEVLSLRDVGGVPV